MTERDSRFKGNEFITGAAQARYYQVKEEMRNMPEIAKLLVIDHPSDTAWLETLAILLYLTLKEVRHERV
jgi:hypothetical protein